MVPTDCASDRLLRCLSSIRCPTRAPRTSPCVSAPFPAPFPAQEAEGGFKEKHSTSSFFRVGTAGQWRSELAPEQVQAIVDIHGDVMARFDYLQEAQQFCAM